MKVFSSLNTRIRESHSPAPARNSFTPLLLVVFCLGACTTAPRAPQTLDVYFVDVEGGQATLIVTPAGETLLYDTGYPGQGRSDPTPGDPLIARDAQRIMSAASDAGISRIDFVLVSHFHKDHFGGLMELAQLIPIDTLIAQGTESQKDRGKPGSNDLLLAYEKVRHEMSHIVPAAGDRIPLEGVETTVVSSAGTVLEISLENAGELNPSCTQPGITPSEPIENPRSTGILLQYGKFRLLNLGDLAGQPLRDLVCPVNRIGPVDVYLVPHHGADDSADPATLAAFRPRVAVINNGAEKGGSALALDTLRNTEGLEGVWQLHLSEAEGAVNFPPQHIANLDTQSAHWIKLSAKADGTFRILNGRTGEWTNYSAQ